MNANKVIVAIFTVLILFWSVSTLFKTLGGGLAPDPNRAVDQGLTKEERLQALLTGEVKSQPRKNPDAGASRIRCIVQDEAGTPVEGATVTAQPCSAQPDPLNAPKDPREIWEGETAADGLVEFRTLPPGELLVAAMAGELRGLARATAAAHDGFVEISITLRPVGELRGRVLNREGAPLRGARVTPVRAPDFTGDPLPYHYLAATSDANGDFLLNLAPPAAWHLLVSAAGFAPALIAPDAEGRYNARLDAGERLAGRVVRDQGGRPVNNAPLELLALDGGGERYNARTNGQGFFAFGALRPGEYLLRLMPGELLGSATVRVAAESSPNIRADTPADRSMTIDPLTGAVVETGDGTAQEDTATARKQPGMELRAIAAGSVRGRVVEAGGGVGVAGVEIAYLPDGGGEPTRVKTDQAGYYHVRHLAPGTGKVFALRDGQRVFTAESSDVVTVAPGEQRTGPVFQEALPTTLSGRVLDGLGGGVPDVNIVVMIEGWPGGPIVRGTDTEGRFALSGFLPSDKVTVRGVRLDRRSSDFGPVTLGGTGLEDVLLRLDQP